MRELVSHLSCSGSGSREMFGQDAGFPSTGGGGTESIAGQPENAEELTSEGSVLRQLTTSIVVSE